MKKQLILLLFLLIPSMGSTLDFDSTEAILEKIGDEQLQRFDADLDINPLQNIFARESYARLQAVHILKDEPELLAGKEAADEPATAQAVQALASQLQKDWARSAPTDSLVGKYGPSTGSKGSLTGREFPANQWAMTYDDGPARQTEKILDALHARDMRATFFWLSKNVPSFLRSSVARAKKEGHELANHSATHPQMTKMSAARQDQEISESTKDLAANYGRPVQFFRLPYGAGVNNLAIRERIANAGMVHVFWNVDSLDWQDRNPDSVYQRVMKQVRAQGRGIILFHDIHDQSVKASAMVMDSLMQNKAEVVTMKKALDRLNGVIP